MNFRSGSSPCCRGAPHPFNNLAALEKALASRQVAAFIVEPIQGKGVNIPDDNFPARGGGAVPPLRHAAGGRRVQTGLGRTGRFLAVEH